MAKPLWIIDRNTELEAPPLVAMALHSGFALRPELAERCALEEATRLHETDLFTDYWTFAAPHRVVPLPSRFEVDLNRTREEAIYQKPEDAWGLNVWKEPLSPDMIDRSLHIYDTFYAKMYELLSELKKRQGRFIVFELHAYNHRRAGPNAPPEDPAQNPDVNVGTGTMDRNYWAPVVDRFMTDLASFDFLGRHLDVRENVKFVGRHFPKWVHETFPETGCVLALEIKKFFMNEWTGEVDHKQLAAILVALRATVSGVLGALRGMA